MNIVRLFALSGAATCAAALAAGSTLSLPQSNLPSSAVVTPPTTAPTPTPAVPLTPAGREYLRNSVNAYIPNRGADLLSRDSLRQAGLSADNDAVERSFELGGRYVAPNHIALAVRQQPTAPKVDPAAQEGARSVARRRLGREPTAAEVAAEVANFDQRVRQINSALAARHDEIAAAYKRSGQFPRDIDAPLLGVAPADPALSQLSPADRAALQAVFTAYINNAAAGAGLSP